jgi:hypothetical protein
METPPNLQVYDLGHLGLVASVLDRIRLVETLARGFFSWRRDFLPLAKFFPWVRDFSPLVALLFLSPSKSSWPLGPLGRGGRPPSFGEDPWRRACRPLSGTGRGGEDVAPTLLPPFFQGRLSGFLTPMVFQKKRVPLRAIRLFLGPAWRPKSALAILSGPLRRPVFCSRRGR